MKIYTKIVFSCAVLSLIFAALVTPAKANEKDCLYVYTVAENIMYNRQNGDTLPDMLTAVKDDAGRTALVKEAFSMYQVMNLQENKDASVKKFSEWAYNQCDKSK